jgi:hypothetical protein
MASFDLSRFIVFNLYRIKEHGEKCLCSKENLRHPALQCDRNYRSLKPHSMDTNPHDIAIYDAGESIRRALFLLSQLPLPH